jgi:hypothetical protein
MSLAILDVLEIGEPLELGGDTPAPPEIDGTPRFVMRVIGVTPGEPIPPGRPRFALRMFSGIDFFPIAPPAARFTLAVNAAVERVGLVRFTLSAAAQVGTLPRARIKFSVFEPSRGVSRALPFRGSIQLQNPLAPVSLGGLTMSDLFITEAAAKDLVSALGTAFLGSPTGKMKLLVTDHQPLPDDLIDEWEEATFDGYVAASGITWGDPVLDDDGNWMVAATAPVQFIWHHTAEDPSVTQTVFGYAYTRTGGELVYVQMFDNPQVMDKEGASITFLPVFRYPGKQGAVLDS